jgi:hypothetical protein
VQEFIGDRPNQQVYFSRGDNYIVVMSAGIIEVFRRSDGRRVSAINPTFPDVFSTLSTDVAEDRVVVGFTDGTVALYDLKTGARIEESHSAVRIENPGRGAPLWRIEGVVDLRFREGTNEVVSIDGYGNVYHIPFEMHVGDGFDVACQRMARTVYSNDDTSGNRLGICGSRGPQAVDLYQISPRESRFVSGWIWLASSISNIWNELLETERSSCHAPPG